MDDFFGLTWPGKDAAAQQASQPSPMQLLADAPASPNAVYTGDNLDVLKLADITADVIYIDPPYNTGRDFGYRDNFRGRRPAHAADFAQWHIPWLNMMLPRLILGRDKLAETGFMFVSIGENEVANLRKVLDEVFGEECFAGQFIWKKAGTGKNDAHYAIVEHEYVLAYAKSADNPGFGTDWDGATSTRYNHRDARGEYSLVRLDSKTLGYVASLDYPITGPDGTVYEPEQPGGERVARWRWSAKKVRDDYDQLVFRNGHVYTKNYRRKGARPRSILAGPRFGVTRTGRRDAEAALGIPGVFDFPKPVGLVSHLISIAAGDDAVVLDFFAGSGTTAEAVARLNRRDGGSRTFHLVQLPEPTRPGSAAARAGFATLAEVCRARVAALGDAHAPFTHYRTAPR